MKNQHKEVAKLISNALANLAVVGFGLAIYDGKIGALIAGIISIVFAIILMWRAEK